MLDLTPYTLLHGHLALPLLRIQNVPDERNTELKRSIGYTTATAVAHDEKWPFTAFPILRATTPKQKQEIIRPSLPCTSCVRTNGAQVYHVTMLNFTRQKLGSPLGRGRRKDEQANRR